MQKRKHMLLGLVAVVLTTTVVFAGDIEMKINSATDAVTIDQFNGSEAMRITADGKVGIGTSAPSEKLEVTDGSIFINGENQGIVVDATGAKRVGLMKYSGHEGYISRVNGADFGITRTAGVDLFDPTNLVTDLYVSQTGNVGIGTTSPITKLHVDGLIHGRINSLDNRAVVTTPETLNTRGVEFNFKQNSVNGLNDSGLYNGVMTFRSYGNNSDWSGGPSHQMAYTSAGRLFHRSGSSTNWNNWQKIIEEDQNGNVGIGTTAPTATLHVVGDIRVTACPADMEEHAGFCMDKADRAAARKFDGASVCGNEGRQLCKIDVFTACDIVNGASCTWTDSSAEERWVEGWYGSLPSTINSAASYKGDNTIQPHSYNDNLKYRCCKALM